ncbi:hypothetical protein ELQ92_00455 [Labedella populi]|uniref:Uncharacterized protein n=1 Tax=Labedella populi TaxID=2498850 RepID=A0A444QDZ8_9MICO|nr:hypothetical protein [Labedella populi]RWZ67785.1 hypothetical protein ELQ92_00455 [Labedella populi]
MALRLSGILIAASAIVQIVLQLVAGSQWSFAVGRPTFSASVVLLAGAAVVLSLRRIGGVENDVTDHLGVGALRALAGLLVIDVVLLLSSPFLPSDLGAAVAYSYLALFVDLLVLMCAVVAVSRLRAAHRAPRPAVLIAAGTVTWYVAAGLFALALPFVIPDASQGLLITLHVVVSMIGPLLTLGTGLVWLAVSRGQ